jgi:hypothetical protein
MNKEEIKNKIKDLSDAKTVKKTVSVIGVVVVAALLFQAGVFVGFHKASFGRDWDDNYENNFGTMHRGSLMMGGMYDRLPNAHGAIGEIIKAELPTLIVLDKDNTEKVVLINDNTKIRKIDGDGTISDLAVGSFVVVIGSPNKTGQIEAKLIRITPNPINSLNKETIPLNSN